MRTIRKRPPPSSLVQWREERRTAEDDVARPFTYAALKSSPVIRDVRRALYEEQGGICAYTGIALRPDDGEERSGFHVEHLVAQQHCVHEPGLDTDYSNLVACWPGPNHPATVPYGAHKKGNWPSPEETGDFVSPLRQDCTSRFQFNRRGVISAASATDQPAKTTIECLGLGHSELIAKRRAAIQGALSPKGKLLSLDQARRLQERLARTEETLDTGQQVQLPAFIFAIRPCVAKEVRKLEGILQSRRGKARNAPPAKRKPGKKGPKK